MDARVRVLVAVAQLDRASYYDVLMVQPGVERKDLQAAFHRFALAFHPDRHIGDEPEIRDAAKRVFERGVEAYTVLRDTALARFYNEQLAKGERRLTAQDFDRFALKAREKEPTSRARPKPAPTPQEEFVGEMKTDDGRVVARRVEKLVAERRYREAYLQMGLLETIEPDNAVVRKRADKIAEFLKRYGDSRR